VLTHDTGVLTFDKVAGTYTVELASPIESFTALATSSGTNTFTGYLPNSSTVDTTQPDVMVTTLAPDFFVQFTGDHATSGGSGVPLQSSTSGSATAYTGGELFTAADTWVSVSGSSNGVASDTVGQGEVLDFNFYNVNPTGNVGLTPTAQASSMYLRFDGIGNTGDIVVNLKLYDTVAHTYTTQAVVVDNADILKPGDILPAGYTAITPLVHQDGLVIIESNDYNTASTHYVIVGAQVITSTEGITGSGIDLNGATGSAGGSSTTEAFGAITTDNDGFKISDIGIVTQTTSTQDANLQFTFTNVDADGDATATQTLNVQIEGSSNTFTGGAAAESIYGTTGDDILTGGGGNDSLTGGLGSDTFKWLLNDQGSTVTPAHDTITDWGTGGVNDKLDLRDLLVGEHSGGVTNLTDFLHFTSTNGGADTTINVSTTGTVGVSHDQEIVLQGVTLASLGADDAAIITNLLNNNRLITDA